MEIIRIIIAFFKKLFHRFFGKKKIVKKVKKNITKAKNNRYLKGYGILTNETFNGFLPLYLIVDEEEKKKLLEKIKLIETTLLETSELLDNSAVNELNKLSRRIEEKKISFYQLEKIDEKISELLSDKKLFDNVDEKIEQLNKEVFDVLDNYDKNLKDRVIKDYKVLNYVTIATVVIDDTIIEIQELKENCKKHKYNKHYYEKEIEKIKKRLNNLKTLRGNRKILEEIEELKKDWFIKSKDKYDLLYNDEIFVNLNKICDDLYNKVSKKVIDIKKEKIVKTDKKEVIKEKEKKKEENDLLEWQERIIKRFEDIELARKILLLRQKQREDDLNQNNILESVDRIYYDFINGEKVVFNYERNKSKTELVKLYNDINYINAKITKKEYYFIDHINYQMNDLIATTMAKKEELDLLLEKTYHIKMNENQNSILVNNKLDLMIEKEEERVSNIEKGKVKIKKNEN